MARVLLMILFVLIIMLGVMLFNSYRKNTSRKGDRKSFEDDIKAVAKEIKMRKER